jgi:hypothetical protein
MKTNRLIVLAAVCFVVCSAILLRRGGADEPARSDSSPFDGKLLSVIGKDSTTAALKDAHIRKLNNHDFLVGTTVAANDYWKPLEGRTMWVAVDTINVIYEFKNTEEIKAVHAAMENVKEHEEQKADSSAK